MKSVLWIMVIMVISVMATDSTRTQSRITELCGKYVDGSQSISLELVLLLSKSEFKDGKPHVLYYKDGKSATIIFNREKETFQVTNNFVSELLPLPVKKVFSFDPETGKPVELEEMK